ncbi:P-loop containing nucleoside triphosphate hydrolase protein, partial [Fragilariopsis cylindrus CCMP1102]
METQRKALPIHNIRNDLIDKLKTSQVIVVSGGTGSGKSTQCPQYILEDAIQNNQGSTTKILVTQPRRIAAISVSERVSQERYEKDASSDNSSVGYAVRFKSKKPRNIGGSIEFVTTGILLRRLLGDDSLLQDISHVMIDEVHERDINTDFLLILFRDLLKKRPDLKLILMSATLDAESFGEYFASNNLTTEVPVLSVPAKPRHPVEVHYLEDLLKMNDEDNYNNNIETEEEQEDDSSRKDTSSTSSSSSSSYTKKNNKIDFRVTMTGLVSEIALHLSQIETDSDRSGSILCFLPGMDEIKQCMKYIEENCSRDLRNKIQILPLHSTIPQDDQQKVFLPAKPGTIKLILSTNIAESSVTIDDVLAVVDSGLVREMNFDAQTAMNAMETNPTSKASATQRLGRAGRVAPGKCYRLYTRSNLSLMDDRPTPEIQRTALEATCLQTCSLINSSSDDDSDDNTDITGVEDFLSRAMDPPVDGAIAFAMDRLTKLGAIATNHNRNGREYLTPLGRTLARLPLDPATGKMLVMGVVMKCLDPLLTAASCFSSRNAF